MRLVAWNCNAGFHRKAAALAALAPDIAVISECAAPEILAEKAPGFAPSGMLWTGDNRHKGLAVFSFGGYELTTVRRRAVPIAYALAARVSGPQSFNLLALWAHYGKAPRTVDAPGPTLAAVDAYRRFLREQPSIVAGDLNNHTRWDKPGKASNHANAVARLAALGLASAYHRFFGATPGAEAHPTLYWRDRTEHGPSYHIDYAFASEGLLQRVGAVRIGTHAEWVASGLSDHVPVIVDIELPAAALSPV
jgi:exodeoxyribonuclease-3